jgi:isopenicillin N synthase-like dioxygenase
MKHNTVQFFSLPLESKAKVAVRGNGFEGFGHHYSRASSGKLDWAESMILVTQPPQDRNMEMWPTNPPTFRSVFHVHLSIDDLPMPRPNSVSSTTRDALEVYSVEMIDLAMRLLGFMAADLGVEQEALLDAFAGKRQSMAIHYYPPCRHREKVMGITPHTDGLGLTLLLHVDDTPGLQIRKDGRWFPVRPLPGAFVINVADILDVLTNGAYASVEHRVIPDSERGRTTVVIFQEASVGGLVAPLPGLLEEEGTHARYKSIEIEEYIKGNFNALEQGTRFIESLRI